ncbi:LLM class flavin-dependent oxidoreductase [Thermomonospora umbrina]|uniref:Alkanesulfonate monooxygenase SsuD/methylene tetrahydromethanopterin reductase-like flavin-dependent oxidoreductase (Luciferase family) n=1 Tax=Thermomonospora umbrina TaxID=111806 RepID=A0A3D9STX6_9ACTN|nr:LLM class flavin-dependent oxidoreductase [Thermomonospora umbrina]REE99057.1 alkanesulfonate monooxygenase SsuD/methylene tetrahydromethanopterin reductase-like flavin-dependent oxidoreductase (luciferase family) [Thermomonospora umbrina]
MKVGLGHTTLSTADGGIADPAETARRAEAAGLDSLWVSDHLAWGMPILESALTLAAAAAVTRRLEIGFSVLQLALRPLPWAAKQIGTLQTLSGGRLQLGVGIGGMPADEWAAAGVPIGERARRTDDALRALPDLLRGDPVELPLASGARVELSPAAPMPKVWIGGASPAALRRAARLGDAWLPAVVTLEQLRDGRRVLREESEKAGRPAPGVGVSVFATLDAHLGGMSHEALVDLCSNDFGYPREHAEAAVVGGKPAQVAERLAAFAEQGVEHVVVVPFGGGPWERQCDLLAEARSLI